MREKHGHRPAERASSTYTAWKNMRARCRYSSNPRHSNYAGRGITVCARWDRSFTSFLQDMGEKPDGMTLERVDNDRGYEPGNCRWATNEEQQRNRSNNRNITANGETLCVTDWAARLGIDPRRIFNRLAKGWPPERAVTVKTSSRWKGDVHG